MNRDYNPPFAYGGHIQRVVFELPARRSERDRTEYAKREARAAMTRQ